ncbi:unnamed protein product [Protopolystoma xenopodis]|uniref:Uncharacterized protein n=1 Tax=Protopolystoma xenopodis TaxID=117903 RepID=A0A3S5CNP5_9PLAT|nr:unnamed protein product [Protopolystoma xenopodis]
MGFSPTDPLCLRSPLASSPPFRHANRDYKTGLSDRSTGHGNSSTETCARLFPGSTGSVAAFTTGATERKLRKEIKRLSSELTDRETLLDQLMQHQPGDRALVKQLRDQVQSFYCLYLFTDA